MGMGRRKHRQDTLWVATAELPRTAGHVFYLNRLTLREKFSRPSLAPGKYFRMLLVGYDSERGKIL